MIRSTGNQHHHWNYFIAIERNIETLSRYIEFTEDNFNTYSIELAHILLSASSEVDVVLKQICNLLGSPKCENITHYREAMMEHEIGQRFANEEINISRFDLRYSPFDNWNKGVKPDWWDAYNKVKHMRNDHFFRASLKNTLNSVGALLLAIIYFYKLDFSAKENSEVSFADTIVRLRPMSTILDISGEDFTIRIMRV